MNTGINPTLGERSKYAVIVAGGNGQRMGTSVPKQFLLVNGKSLLWFTLQAFLQTFSDIQIILVLPDEHLPKGKEIINELDETAQNKIKITVGGVTRFHSVKNGLKLVEQNSIVFVHDAVRCLVDKGLIERCYRQALGKGSAIPAIAATDSIRMIERDKHFVFDRNNIRIIQTPQTFKSEILLPAFQQPYNENFTDEATVVEATGQEVFLIEGNHQNIKITRPVDLAIAEKILQERNTL